MVNKNFKGVRYNWMMNDLKANGRPRNHIKRVKNKIKPEIYEELKTEENEENNEEDDE